MRLNGWRRMGLAVAGVWMLGCTTLTVIEYVAPQSNAFVFHAPPDGTIVDESLGTVTIPDGKVIQLRETAGKGFPKAWDIKWADYPEIPTRPLVRWQRLSVVSVVVPLFLWILVELAVAAIAWIKRGFQT